MMRHFVSYPRLHQTAVHLAQRVPCEPRLRGVHFQAVLVGAEVDNPDAGLVKPQHSLRGVGGEGHPHAHNELWVQGARSLQARGHVGTVRDLDKADLAQQGFVLGGVIAVEQRRHCVEVAALARDLRRPHDRKRPELLRRVHSRRHEALAVGAPGRDVEDERQRQLYEGLLDSELAVRRETHPRRFRPDVD